MPATMPDFGLTSNHLTILTRAGEQWLYANFPPAAIPNQPRFPELVILPPAAATVILAKIRDDGLTIESPTLAL